MNATYVDQIVAQDRAYELEQEFRHLARVRASQAGLEPTRPASVRPAAPSAAAKPAPKAAA